METLLQTCQKLLDRYFLWDIKIIILNDEQKLLLTCCHQKSYNQSPSLLCFLFPYKKDKKLSIVSA